MTTRFSPRLVALTLIAASALLLTSSVGAHDDPHDGKTEILGTPLHELPRAATQSLTYADCENGTAGIFPCENVDLMSFVPLEAMGGGTGNDIWGWTDPQTGREYAIAGTSNGTAFVDVTDPKNPEVVGQMPSQSFLIWALWRDIKVYDNHAFVVSEYDLHGMQVFDLTRLRDVAVKPTVFTPDAVYDGISNTHNIAINEETGFAYAVGTNTCRAGLHMIDIRDPKNPQLAGCFADDGYTHDVQCVVYRGPDARYKGREICFASNEDTVTIVDVTDKQNPRMLSRTGYESAAYTHQGWLTPDQRYFLFGDELDEQTATVPSTTTYVMDARRLTSPATPVPFHHATPAIDHNLYIDGQYVFESNYTAGLRILEYDKKTLAAGKLREVAYFDVFPASDLAEFLGTWSNYPYFDSGTVVVNAIDSGLFVLRPELMR
jgi:choice-of-anchor B domain-containing protein